MKKLFWIIIFESTGFLLATISLSETLLAAGLLAHDDDAFDIFVKFNLMKGGKMIRENVLL